ncbi:hypothetical protein CDO52_01725 [Nocardiopsis gilva YIM 90087]|uniref:Uncharacterized protein n=1 Tax=Nocardiopsis gilva YIM 90087 TaxID=1235441 RepID=A0A223S0M4_9ACTN|nr:hypothetical protein [Nocardiopsis gilva]ASU81683.1 hypothetical protein CDO52_01725 [Nocardiopsis gilva YIM 90087]
MRRATPTSTGLSRSHRGDRTVIGYGMAAPVLPRLRGAGIKVIAVEGDESVKGRARPVDTRGPVEEGGAA